MPVGVCGFDVPVCGIDSASVALRSAELLILTWFQTRVCVLVLCTQSQHSPPRRLARAVRPERDGHDDGVPYVTRRSERPSPFRQRLSVRPGHPDARNAHRTYSTVIAVPYCSALPPPF